MSRLKGKIEWIDIVKPTRQDIDALRRIHHFHPVTLDELLQYSERSRVERIDDVWSDATGTFADFRIIR